MSRRGGGKAEPVTRYDPQTEITHRWPVFLPDGRHFLYVSRVRGSESREMGRLMLASLESPDATVLVEDASNALYVIPGYLIYGRSANLYARRFDARSLKLEGDPAPLVLEKVSFWEAKNFVPFAASDDGTIVYLPDAQRLTEMRWYDRQGGPLGTIAPAATYQSPRISPDGRKIAYVRSEASLNDIWLRDLEFNRSFRLTQQSGLYDSPVWTPDSARIAFIALPCPFSFPLLPATICSTLRSLAMDCTRLFLFKVPAQIYRESVRRNQEAHKHHDRC